MTIIGNGKLSFIQLYSSNLLDQEPCTALFVEVANVEQNDGIEAVHGIREPQSYNRLDTTSFDEIPLDNLKDQVEKENSEYKLLKAYCKDYRGGET